MRRKGATAHSSEAAVTRRALPVKRCQALMKQKIRLAIWTGLHLQKEKTRERECGSLKSISIADKTTRCDHTRDVKFLRETFNGILLAVKNSWKGWCQPEPAPRVTPPPRRCASGARAPHKRFSLHKAATAAAAPLFNNLSTPITITISLPNLLSIIIGHTNYIITF